MTTSSSNERCTAYAWCTRPDGHTFDDHGSRPHAVSATSDPETYEYDLASGVVRTPLVMTYLAAAPAEHSSSMGVGVALNVSIPGERRADVDVRLSLRETRILRDQLTELLDEARDAGKVA